MLMRKHQPMQAKANLYQFIVRTVALLAIAVLLVFIVPKVAFAGELASRSITVSTSVPSATTTHTYAFSIGTANSVGSMAYEYCTNTPFVGTACAAPAGLSVSGASIASQTGETGFIVHPNTTANRLVIGRAPSVTTPQPVQYAFNG